MSTTCTYCRAVVDNNRPAKRAHAATHPDADQNHHGFITTPPTRTTHATLALAGLIAGFILGAGITLGLILG
ncbi:MAG: hypothetical protein HY830_14075 [Actinobacteria bacterium]|nr:hypothetical protein [Actinomycetota bacterium]